MGTIDINDSNNFGDIIREINNDGIDKDTKMSKIDMNARLSSIEISSVLALDTLVSMDFLPVGCLKFTRQKKRLSVSLDGKGRQEIVKIFNNSDMEETESGKNTNFIKRLMGKSE